MALDIYINVEAKSLERAAVVGTKKPKAEARLREIVQASSVDYILHLIDNEGDYDSRSGSGAVTVKVSVSKRGGTARFGGMTISDDSSTSPRIEADASATSIESILNAMNSNAGVNGGLVDVEDLGTGNFLVTWRDVGARSLLNGTSIDLVPSSYLNVVTYRTGTATVRAQQLIEVAQMPVIYTEDWTPTGTTFTGTINASTGRVAEALNDDPSVELYFEVKVDDEVIASLPVRLLPNAAGAGVTAPPYDSGVTYAQQVAAPATASSTGTSGQIAYDSNYFYQCVATDTWVRTPLAQWT